MRGHKDVRSGRRLGSAALAAPGLVAGCSSAGGRTSIVQQAVVYQIYPRSFADSGGDGLGDLRGIISRIPYLASLGVDAVWLSPFYPSALADGGYDVDDYRDVDPQLGTLADFDEMTAGLHARKIKVIVDIVPNHTSNRHAWFREALAAPKGSPARDRYIFRDGLGPEGGQPPSDWLSGFGGPAWAQVPDGQWYLHLFAAEQPDLNWENREVRDDFLTTLRFWSDRGVDGFRVDVAHGLAKNMAEPLESLPALWDIADDSLPSGTHPLWDRDEVHDIYAEWRQVFNEYAGEFLRTITDNLSDAQRQGSSTTWVLSNHGVVRHATRYGLSPEDRRGSQNSRTWLLSGGTTPRLDRGLGLRRARAAVLLVLALPGSAYLYQGEELGLGEVGDIPAKLLQDPAFFRSHGVEKGRDGCRVPLPWTADGPSFGFGTGAAHLPQPAWFGPLNVETQDRAPASTLMLYRHALSWRRKLQAGESMEWMPGTNGQVLHLGRPGGLAVGDQLRARSGAGAARPCHPLQRPGRGQPAARGHHRLDPHRHLGARTPGDELVRAAGIDHPVRREAELFRPDRAVDQPVQLAGRVRVGVDGEDAADLGGQGEQPVRRVLALRPAVDLHRDAFVPAGGEDRLGVEDRLRPAAAAPEQPPGAVAEHVHVPVPHRGHHPVGHRLGGHPQLGVDAGHHHVELAEQVLVLVE